MRIHSRWKTCKDCDLCDYPRVFLRTSETKKPPVDALFIGEAPGENEVILKEPLVGVSGRLLQSAIDKVLLHNNFTYVITNTVICTPYEDETKSAIGKPTPLQANRCFFHIEDCIRVYQPRVIFALGNVSQGVLKRHKVDHVPLRHPAFVLRRGGQGSLEYKKFFLLIRREIINAQKEQV